MAEVGSCVLAAGARAAIGGFAACKCSPSNLKIAVCPNVRPPQEDIVRVQQGMVTLVA